MIFSNGKKAIQVGKEETYTYMLYMKANTIKFLEKNIGEIFYELEVSKDFLNTKNVNHNRESG